MKKLKVVFLGTPDFAVASMKAIHESDHELVGAITMPDKPAGRGKKLQSSPVKNYAVEHNIPLLQPSNLKDEEFLADLKAWGADIFIVVAFRMLPEAVWNMPEMGTVNLHGSLLPDYRGAAPINWAVMNGDTKTGVSTFQLKHKIDTGDILLQESTPISEDDNVGTVHDRLMNIGANLIVTTLDQLSEGTVKPLPQDSFNEGPYREAPKLFKPDCLIDWSKDQIKIFNQIRGLSPYPAAYTVLSDGKEEKNMKIFKTLKSEKKIESGKIEIEAKKVFIGTNTHALELIEVQLAGKKRMTVKDLLNGFSFEGFQTK